MVEVRDDDTGSYFSVPIEATAFLAAVSAFAIILLIFVMYINKKLRLFNISVEKDGEKRGSLMEEKQQLPTLSPIPLSAKLRSKLGDDYSMTLETSSDSEEDVLGRLKQLKLKNQAILLKNPYIQHHSHSPLSHTTPRPQLSKNESFHHYSKLDKLHGEHEDFYTHSLNKSHFKEDSPLHHENSLESRKDGNIMMGSRPLRVSAIRNVGEGSLSSSHIGTSSNSRRRGHLRAVGRSSTLNPSRVSNSADLMSLAEKGKVGGGSSASSTSSNVSADLDDPTRRFKRHPTSTAALHRLAQRRDIFKTTSTSHSSSSSQPSTHPPLLRTGSRESRELVVASRSHPVTVGSSGGGLRRMMSLPPRTKSVDSESPPPSEVGLSNYGDSIADQDENIFEVEEMSVGEEGDLGLIGERRRAVGSNPQCGSVEVAFDYEAAAKKMTVHIIQARGIPTKDVGGADTTQVRVVLLPSRKNRQKTKVRPGENPQYLESFVFSKINPEDVSSLGIRVRLYGCERMRRERLLGEAVLGFASLHLEMETTLWLNFEPRYHLTWDSRSETGSIARSDSASSTQSIQNGIPEILVGLAYNGTTGRLTVEIIKGSHFRNLAGGRAPDSYVKLVLVGCNGQEMGRAKSSLRRSQSNPLFKETFMFQVALFQVSEVTLLISVYGRKGVTRRELLGWFSLGYNSSGDEETTHWEDMCDAQGDQMCRWHILLQT